MENKENSSPILLVTANDHETQALLEDTKFFEYDSGIQSDDDEDALHYNVGLFGQYSVVHFQIPEQASVRADGSLASVSAAIRNWDPVAVILVGIAFGKDNEDKPDPRQHIGDVLVSTRIIDYESGKVKGARLQSDGPQPEAGRHLQSAFKYHSKTWNHLIKDRAAQVQFGAILSGDKVVDDAKFKMKLFNEYKRAIGGEMEGRGAYAAARRSKLTEWIVVKAICDWGENKDNPNKEMDQVVAARSVASLLRHVFGGRNLEKLYSRAVKHSSYQAQSTERGDSAPKGYFINVGTTTCRLFQVRDDHRLVELKVIPYANSDYSDENYLSGVTQTVKSQILPEMTAGSAQLFLKVYADVGFNEIFESFEDPSRRTDFIREFYQETNLYFNIVSSKQTEENLKRLFANIGRRAAVINVDSQGADVLHLGEDGSKMYRIQIALSEIRDFVDSSNFPSVWTKAHVDTAKKYIRDQFNGALDGVVVDEAVLIKDELRFMTSMTYGLKLTNGSLSLTQPNYRRANFDKLFGIDLHRSLQLKYPEDDATVRRLYGFRYGHLLIETILDEVNNRTVIPKDDLTIHGNHLNAYVFNVVLSGSTHDGRDQFIIQAHDLVASIGVNVLSPQIVDGALANPISPDSEYEHLKAIDECDVLLVCNQGDNGYIGDATKCEIYYAYALKKTIAFWEDPPEVPNGAILNFIPRENWGAIDSMIPKTA